MFTGLVEDVGVVRERAPRGPGARLRVGTRLGPLVLGESIAVDGACLTVDRVVDGGFEADCSAETLRVTTLGRVSVGRRVHLERALQVGGRLGGHFVAGHVDGLATLVGDTTVGQARRLVFRLPTSLSRFVVVKGSIAINGVSLTVNEVAGDEIAVMVVPHSQEQTVLVELRTGEGVNVEVDMLARFVARLLEAPGGAPAAPAEGEGLLARMRSAGYLGEG